MMKKSLSSSGQARRLIMLVARSGRREKVSWIRCVGLIVWLGVFLKVEVLVGGRRLHLYSGGRWTLRRGRISGKC